MVETVDFGFTEREKEILQRVSKAMMNDAIAMELFISSLTVKSHVQSIYQKLEDHGVIFMAKDMGKRLQLLIFAQEYQEERLRPTLNTVPTDDFY